VLYFGALLTGPLRQQTKKQAVNWHFSARTERTRLM
jgi:hypothetical protein